MEITRIGYVRIALFLGVALQAPIGVCRSISLLTDQLAWIFFHFIYLDRMPSQLNEYRMLKVTVLLFLLKRLKPFSGACDISMIGNDGFHDLPRSINPVAGTSKSPPVFAASDRFRAVFDWFFAAGFRSDFFGQFR
jgi:hypothetical protein